MAADIENVFTQIKEDITRLTKTYPDHEHLIKSELHSLNEFIGGVYKSLIVKLSGNKQPRTSDARRRIVDKTYKGRNKGKGKETNDFKRESQEHNPGGDGANIFSGDTSTEKSGREKRKRQEGPENSLATEECVGDRNSATLPCLEIPASGLPKEHNSPSSPKRSVIILPDSSLDIPQVIAWDSQSETLIYNWSRQTNLPSLLEIAHQLPDGVIFNLPRNEKSFPFRFDKAEIVQMFTRLQPQTELSDNEVDYFLSRIATGNDVQVFNVCWYSPKGVDPSKPAPRLDLVSGIRTLIPCSNNSHWSCLEVDPKLGTITHYDSLLGTHCCATGGRTKKAGCRYCRRVGDMFSTASASLAPGGWDFLTPECQQQDNGVDCGVFMLSNLQNRARGLDLDRKLFPDQCRFNIAIGLVGDILAAKATEDIVQAMSSDTKRVPFEWVKRSSSLNDENTAPLDTDEERWANFEAVHQSQGWVSQLKQMAQEEPVNRERWKRASRLLQLVANIASPLTLVEVKRQLAELRRHQLKPRVSSNHLHGAYFAGLWHDSNTLRSSMCIRLISWFFRNEVVRRMTNTTKMRLRVSKGRRGAKETAIDRLVRDIRLLDREVGGDSAAHSDPLSSLISVNKTRTTANDDKATENEMKRRIGTWYQTGGSWSRLATAAGSPACVCLLPSGTNIVAEERPIYASEYRDLSMCQAEILGTLLSLLRPRMRSFFPKELWKAFLRNSPPSRRFQIESWSDDWIRSQSLDSDELAKAFELQSEELVV